MKEPLDAYIWPFELSMHEPWYKYIFFAEKEHDYEVANFGFTKCKLPYSS